MEMTRFKAVRYQPNVDQVGQNIYDQYELSCAMRYKLVENSEDVKVICNKAARYLTDPTTRPWLFIVGNMGTGKTTLMKAMGKIIKSMRRTNTEYFSAMQISALDLPKIATDPDLRPRYEQILTGNDGALYQLIDDIGQEPTEVKSYGNSLIPFVEVVNKRYERQIPMIITSNLNLQDIKEKYGDRVADRIHEMAEVLNFKGNTYR